MMVKDKIKPKGLVSIVLKDEHGNVKETHTQNLVVNTGLAFIASRIVGTASPVISHMGVGSGDTAAAGSQTGLITQLSRVALTSTAIVTTNVTDDSVQFVAEFPAGVGTGAVVEAGLFNADVDGTMISRTVFPVVNKSAPDSLVITWILVLN